MSNWSLDLNLIGKLEERPHTPRFLSNTALIFVVFVGLLGGQER